MKARMADSSGNESKIFLFAVFALLGGTTVYILSNGFYLEGAMERWAMIVGTLDANDLVLENLTFLTPHIPLYLLIPFHYIPGLDTGAAPYLVSLLAAALLLYLWVRDMRDADISQIRLVILMVLVVVHPAFLWAATSGGYIALSMIAFYLLYRAAQHVISLHDLHSYISLAVVFFFFFFIDGSAIFIFVALLPLLVVIAPVRTIMVSPMSLYLIVGTPFAFAVGTWAYMNWIFEGSFTHFITNADSAFLGGMLHIDEYPWLKDYGGQFFKPLLAATGYMLVAYPVTVYLLLDTMDNSHRFRATFVLLIHPLIAIAIATSQNYLSHPFEILTLISAGIMAELTYVKMQTKREFVLLVLFMMVSVAGGWWLFIETGTPQMKQWVGALHGENRMVLSAKDGDLQLGLWLKSHRQPTLIYERSAYKVIAARGDAKGLMLSFSREFKTAMRERSPSVAQVAVPSPSSLLGGRDKINSRYPNLYDHGMKGFERVYDSLGWRVYRQKHV